MESHGHHVALVDVPGPGDNLDGLVFAHIQLADPHVVAVRVAFHFLNAARHHVGNFRAKILGGLHLGAGEGHGLGEIFIVGVNRDKLAEPFSA